MEVAGPLGTPLGLAQRKRASPRGEAGTSGFLCVSDSDRRGPAELGQESQASSCLRKGTPLASRVAQGVSGPSSSCVWNPRVFADDARGWQCPFVLCLHGRCYLRSTWVHINQVRQPFVCGVSFSPYICQKRHELVLKVEKSAC